MSTKPDGIFNKKTIFIVVALLLSLAITTSSVLAWITYSNTNQAGGINLILERDEQNVSIQEVYGTLIDTSYLLTPGNSISLDLKVENSCLSFGVMLETSSPNFSTAFADRNDLTTGAYQIQRSMISTNESGTEFIYQPFDIDSHLSAVTPALSSTAIADIKADFYQRFREDNSIHSALSVTITKIDGVTTNILLTKEADSEVYYPESPLSLNANQQLTISITYNNTVFVPTVVYATTDEGATYFAPTAQTTYIMDNYNCFVGISIELSFETT